MPLSSVFGEPPRDAAKSGSKFKSELLVDNGRLFFILSDRREKITEFFQRNQVVVGAMWQQDLDKLEKANEPIANIFLDYTSANDDPEKAARYGDYLTLAPLAPGVAELIEKHAAPRERWRPEHRGRSPPRDGQSRSISRCRYDHAYAGRVFRTQREVEGG